MYSFVKNEKRRKLLGLITQLDDAIGLIVSKLATLGILDETIIAFTSDNGGPVYHSGNNSPLRGSKATVFEGGTRVRAFINAPDLVPFVNDGMFHAVDWLPTLLNAAIDNLNSMCRISYSIIFFLIFPF
jgi:arylsulfatase A-like enzyme